MSDLAYGLELLSGGQIEAHDTWYRCRCTTLLMVRRVKSNGTVVGGRQCQICGRFEAISKHQIPQKLPDLPEYRERIREGYFAALSALQRQRSEVEKAQQDQQWWGAYNAYLASPAWRVRRDKVLRRAGGVCECCLTNSATQVHHTTYEHVGNEPLWELRAICEPCHEELTELDRARRERRNIVASIGPISSSESKQESDHP